MPVFLQLIKTKIIVNEKSKHLENAKV